MRVEKQGSESEGGRGLQYLLDWHSKSSKKLVSKIPDLSVQPKQKANINASTQITQYHPVIEDYTSSTSILKGCTSSLIVDDHHGKSPGVVARLMGLDSLPNSHLSNSKSTRFFDTGSMQKSSALHVIKSPELEQKDYCQIEQKHKIIEKFQADFLPPKSARLVPITQHKLLSLVKNPQFVSSNDPTSVMAAASKIVIPLSRSSSVDFSNRKSPATRPVESNAARKLRGQSMNKSWDGCLEPKDGRKSVSLAIQAKVNVKKREGGARSPNNQPIVNKNTLKKPAANRVLKQNNKKQNCVTDRGKSAMNTQFGIPVSDKSSTVITVSKTVGRRKCVTEDVKSRGGGKQDRNGKAAAKSNGLDVVSFTFTSPLSRSTNKINRNSLNSEGGFLTTILDQNLRELTAMTPGSVYRESRITRTIIFQDKRNRDRTTSKDHQVADQKFDAVFSKKWTTTKVDTKSTRTESERCYVKAILSNIESMFDDFTLNRTSKIVNPHLFDQLEAQEPGFDKRQGPKRRRKLVFDCVSECVDSRCGVWLRGLAAVRTKDRFVEQVCNKIAGWEKMKDCMVDELVDKDMSSGQRKKWLDFDFAAFEIGVEIEGRLLGFLINEAIVDMLVSC